MLFKNVIAQAFTTEKNDSTNIYQFALKEYSSGDNEEIVYIEKVFPVNDHFPAQINRRNFIYVTHNELDSILKCNNTKVKVIQISPLKTISNLLFIEVFSYFVDAKEGQIVFELNDGISVYFKFNCINGQIEYIYDEIYL
jgi:hypothetical protein